MTRIGRLLAFGLGGLAVAWVAWGYLGHSPLALVMTLLIAATYLAGGLELWRFQQATAGLQAALAALTSPPPRLTDWLAQLPPSLRQPVRLRVEGERVGLPGPALTPYLVGLLVLLGMLGTFLGMVVTLNGAVMALESTTDLPTIRAALAAPVKGLGLAFGTSVAGVAASAMLGLVSALCRRERLQAAQALDGQVGAGLRGFSAAHQREATLDALQNQVQALPAVLGQVQALMAQMSQQQQDLNDRLLAGQDRFHGQTTSAFESLAASVDRSLQDSLAGAARQAGALIEPVVRSTLAGLARDSAALQAGLAAAVQAQLDGLSTRFDKSAAEHAEVWAASLDQQARHLAAQQAGAAAADAQRLAAWSAAWDEVAAGLRLSWQQTGADSLRQQQQICQTLAETATGLQDQADRQARATLGELSRLIDAAADAPRAAAEVAVLARQQLVDSLARDNGLLDERQHIMAALHSLLDAVRQATMDQRQAIDGLVVASAGQLQQAGEQLHLSVAAQAQRLDSVAAQLTGSAVDVASLGEAFGAAVGLFSASSQALTGQMQRVEGALGQSMARSDEQLGYYVAQARELIELSVSAQKQIVDALQALAQRPLAALGEAA